MKKAKFFIIGYFEDGMTKPVDGYVFNLGEYTFGCHKDLRHWNITEITTGMKVFEVQKRADAIPELEKRNTIAAINYLFSHIVKGDKIDSANAAIQAAYKNMGMKMPVF